MINVPPPSPLTTAPHEPPAESPAAHEPGTTRPPLRRLRTDEIFGDHQRIVLEHQGHEYVLLKTRRGGLLLNLLV